MSLRVEPGTLCFGPFRVTRDGMLLRRGGSAISLPPKQLALLRLLAGAGGRVVSKREILDRLWPGEEIGEASLTSCIHGLRAVLGARGRHGRYLETVHGRGYRFSAEVQREGIAGAAAPSRLRVAIAPFEEERDSPAYLTEGLVADVIARLGRLQAAGVDAIARQSVARIWARRGEPLALARELQLAFVVTGRIRSGKREIGVSLELTRVSDDVVVWTGEFASRKDERAQLAAEIAEALAKHLVEFRGGEFTAERRAPISLDPRAYAALLRGSFLNQFRTESGLRRSIACFEQALAWDPRCAGAHAALAEAYLNLGWRGYVAPREIAPVVRAGVTRALEIDGQHVGALSLLALLRLVFDWDIVGAEEALAVVEAFAPPGDRVAWVQAHVPIVAGRFDAALAGLDAALELDPLSPNLAVTRVHVLYCSGRNEEALTAARALTRAEPEFAIAQGLHGVVAATAGRLDEALSAAEEADRLARGDQLARTASAWTFAVAGRPEAARTILATLERRAQSRYVSPSLVASVYAGLGDREAALAWLERAAEARCMWFPFIGVDPRLAPLHGDPRFDALMRLIGGPRRGGGSPSSSSRRRPARGTRVTSAR